MSVVQAAKAPAVFDLRSAALTLIAVALKTADLAALAGELESRFGGATDVFDGDPIAIDLSQVSASGETIDFAALTVLLRQYRMLPVVVRGGSPEQIAAARAAGLAVAPAVAAKPAGDETKDAAPAAAPEAAEPVPAPAVAASTQFVDKPLRSGQRVYAKGGDLVVLAVVSFGA